MRLTDAMRGIFPDRPGACIGHLTPAGDFINARYLDSAGHIVRPIVEAEISRRLNNLTASARLRDRRFIRQKVEDEARWQAIGHALTDFAQEDQLSASHAAFVALDGAATDDEEDALNRLSAERLAIWASAPGALSPAQKLATAALDVQASEIRRRIYARAEDAFLARHGGIPSYARAPRKLRRALVDAYERWVLEPWLIRLNPDPLALTWFRELPARDVAGLLRTAIRHERTRLLFGEGGSSLRLDVLRIAYVAERLEHFRRTREPVMLRRGRPEVA